MIAITEEMLERPPLVVEFFEDWLQPCWIIYYEGFRDWQYNFSCLRGEAIRRFLFLMQKEGPFAT